MRADVTRACCFGSGLLLMVVSAADTVRATTAPGVPEIDGGTIPIALGILSAGVLLLRARRSK